MVEQVTILKKIYSVILLFAFCIGALQPILPMIEYQMQTADIVRLITGEEYNLGASDELTCYQDRECEAEEHQDDSSLLNIDYYPLALQLTSVPIATTFWHETRCYLPPIRILSIPTDKPILPPPKISGSSP